GRGAAVMAATGNGQDDVITLQAGVYRLTVTNTNGQENAAAQADLDLTETGRTVTFRGAGAGATFIDAGALDRVFQVMGDVTVVFRDMTIRNGYAADAGEAGFPAQPGALGGGIMNLGNTTLERVVVERCTAAADSGANGAYVGAVGETGGISRGGGILNWGSSLRLVQSTVRNNFAYAGAGGAGNYAAGGVGGSATGGGIDSVGRLDIIDSALDGNEAHGRRRGDGGRNERGPDRD